MLQRFGNHLESILRKCFAYLKRHGHYLTILIIFLSFAIPFTLLYCLDAQSFNQTWKGRTFYLFFIWLIILETIMSLDKLQLKITDKSNIIRIIALAITLLLPTSYVVAANFFGLNTIILQTGEQLKVPRFWDLPLSIEYLVFAGFFGVIIFLAYGTKGLNFSLAMVFLGAIGSIYLIDTLYPEGRFTPFQIFVPTTAMLAANVLNFIGYQTVLFGIQDGMPRLFAYNSQGSAIFSIAWPCSGVQSLIIYICTILLFFRKTTIPWMHRAAYFFTGAFITYCVNILRIVSIFVIAINSGDWRLFHDYYGELYAMTWILSYPLIIIGSRMFWAKIKLRLASNNAARQFRQPTSVQGS